ncbi:MAG: Holliday junction resolvase RecU [Clostridium sp.]|nr:Holliday junction resolvase RecU [Clostridium sp.]MCM1443849.1 Holliday junction resolvase RecU [Candidatus Amulumruptor caecigallinarius]
MLYPSGSKPKNHNNINYANRGMNLEAELNETNNYYLINDIAVIYKKPTPITIHKVDYKSRYNAVITDARFSTPSTTDYNGIYRGKYIDFEAKETHNQSFPINNIHKHQILHLERVYKHGAIAFLIVRFTKQNKTFLLSIDNLLNFLKDNTRKSIPISYFEKYGHIIKDKYCPRVDYIEVLNKIYFKGD